MSRDPWQIATGRIAFVQESRFLLRLPGGTARHFVLHRRSHCTSDALGRLYEAGCFVRVRYLDDASLSTCIAMDIVATPGPVRPFVGQ